MSVEGFLLKRVINHTSIWIRGEIKQVGQIILNEIRFLIIIIIHHELIMNVHTTRLLLLMMMIGLLHLDAEYLRLRHGELHLQLRHLVLEVRDGAHAAVHRIPCSSVRLVH